MLLTLLCGCMDQELDTYYGRHEIPALSASVNGTDVLAEMFKTAGHDVYFRRTLVTSEMEAADTIVWFPNDYAVPTAEACEWFENWLYESPGRTLVYVGRDFDAAPLYWKHMKARVGKDQIRGYELRELYAKSAASRPSNLKETDLKCEWFRFEPDATRDADKLAGPWAKDIDGAKSEIQLGTKLIPDRAGKRLLTASGDRLATQFSRRFWEGGRILLVTNGSFLLNLPLVNHEHRKLAATLIAATGDPGQVVFLESGPGGPPIDPAYADQSLWTLFGAWPLNVILLQLAVAGVMFCFARWPIFGRPKQPAPESTSDFARHVWFAAFEDAIVNINKDT
ncbi:MAG: hypothetical protein WDZ48_05605, partial [Pirellulales bacterium]